MCRKTKSLPRTTSRSDTFEQNVDVPVPQSVEQVVDDPMPQAKSASLGEASNKESTCQCHRLTVWRQYGLCLRRIEEWSGTFPVPQVVTD